jgi:hypothetical protein
MPGLHMKSRANRTPVLLEASVVVGNTISNVEVTDLTGDGCCVTGSYRIGEWISITFPRTEAIRAQVRWTIFGKAGLRFERSFGR